MTSYRQGDLVLLDFGFSEGEGSKKRPALIVSSNPYHQSRQEVIVLAITSNIDRLLVGDTKIDAWKKAGLLYPSVVTGIIRTVKKNIIMRKLGTLLNQDFQKVQENLGVMLSSSSNI